MDEQKPRPLEGNPAAVVAIIVALFFGQSLLNISIAVLWIVIDSRQSLPTSGENLTQVLMTWGTGLVGVIGAFVGYAFGSADRITRSDADRKVG